MCASEDGERGGTPLVQGPMRARQSGAVIRARALPCRPAFFEFSPILDDSGVRRARAERQTAAPYARSRAAVQTLGEDVGRVGLGLRWRAPARWGRGTGAASRTPPGDSRRRARGRPPKRQCGEERPPSRARLTNSLTFPRMIDFSVHCVSRGPAPTVSSSRTVDCSSGGPRVAAGALCCAATATNVWSY